MFRLIHLVIIRKYTQKSYLVKDIYRVSIKFFPDYKHVLQEIMLEHYVAPQLEEFQPWIIFQQDGAPPHWRVHMLVSFWMQHFQIGGLGEMVRHPGHHDRRISPLLTSFYGGTLRTKCFRHQFQILRI